MRDGEAVGGWMGGEVAARCAEGVAGRRGSGVLAGARGGEVEPVAAITRGARGARRRLRGGDWHHRIMIKVVSLHVPFSLTLSHSIQ